MGAGNVETHRAAASADEVVVDATNPPSPDFSTLEAGLTSSGAERLGVPMADRFGVGLLRGRA